jgi:hypothetical protein
MLYSSMPLPAEEVGGNPIRRWLGCGLWCSHTAPPLPRYSRISTVLHCTRNDGERGYKVNAMSALFHQFSLFRELHAPPHGRVWDPALGESYHSRFPCRKVLTLLFSCPRSVQGGHSNGYAAIICGWHGRSLCPCIEVGLLF